LTPCVPRGRIGPTKVETVDCSTSSTAGGSGAQSGDRDPRAALSKVTSSGSADDVSATSEEESLTGTAEGNSSTSEEEKDVEPVSSSPGWNRRIGGSGGVHNWKLRTPPRAAPHVT